ncbi:MAG: SapC family protein [Caulobacteraceae bacterium]|nr:SapC family protein [Caulobacteraceae bacterium]
MAADVQPANSPLSGQVLLYVNPEPLDSSRHRKLGMLRSDRPFSFAARQHFVPLHVGEFAPAATNYPIIFAGEQRAPLAVMGVNAGENLFISAEGVFRTGAYVPAFIRRYPFVVARDQQLDRMVVCIDRDFALFTENKPDVMLFEDGQPSAFTKGCIDFCSQFDADSQMTQSFVKLLGDLDLFESKQTTFAPRAADGTTGEPQLVAEYFAVSEERLKKLPDAKLAELRDNGALAQIYAHMVSLYGWDRLILETIERNNLAVQVPNA